MCEAADFWDFSLSHYRQSKKICLKWQNEHKLNVNLILLCCYLEQQGVAIGPAQFQPLENAIERTEMLLSHLRPLRLACKSIEAKA